MAVANELVHLFNRGKLSKPRVRLGYNLSHAALFENLQAVWNLEKKKKLRFLDTIADFLMLATYIFLKLRISAF